MGFLLESKEKPLKVRSVTLDSSKNPIEATIFSLVNFFKNLDWADTALSRDRNETRK